MSTADPTLSAAAAPASAIDVVQALMLRDRFSQWLGLEVVEAAVGRCVLRMTVRDDMVNGFGTSHGGILFSLADSAFAFATNAGGVLSVAIDCMVSFPVAVQLSPIHLQIAMQHPKQRSCDWLRQLQKN